MPIFVARAVGVRILRDMNTTQTKPRDMLHVANSLAKRIERRAGYTPENLSAAWRLVDAVDWIAFRSPGEAKIWTDAIKRLGRGAGIFVNGAVYKGP